jgi:hypothetical protein
MTLIGQPKIKTSYLDQLGFFYFHQCQECGRAGNLAESRFKFQVEHDMTLSCIATAL